MKLDTNLFLPQDFENAADILDRRGWCQRTEVARDGRVSALGALSLARAERLKIKLDIKQLSEQNSQIRFGAISTATYAILDQVFFGGVWEDNTYQGRMSIYDDLAHIDDRSNATKEGAQTGLLLAGVLLEERMKKEVE